MIQLYEGWPQPGNPPLKEATCNRSDLEAGDPSILKLREDLQVPNVAVDVQALGGKLYDFLGPEITDAWQDLAGQTPADLLRTYIEASVDYADLPWEFVSTPDEEGLPDLLATTQRQRLVRFHEGVEDKVCTDRILRVLVITGAEFLDNVNHTSPAETEIGNIGRVLQKADRAIHIEVLRQPKSLKDMLARIHDVNPHVLHIITHGLQAGKVRALQFEGFFWDTLSIKTNLGDLGEPPRLVVLNACHSAQPWQGSASLARVFARAGVPAVVANQAPVVIENAFEFTKEFYSRLAACDPIDEAVRRARLAIANHERLTGLLSRDWGIPTLSLGMEPEKVLPIPEYNDTIRACEIRKEVMVTWGPFVGREKDRRDVLQALTRFGTKKEPARGVLIRGAEDTGKSWLIRRIMGELAQLGDEVRYCELACGQEVGYRDILLRLRDGWPQGPKSLVFESTPGDFTVFNKFESEFGAKYQASGFKGIPQADIDGLFANFLAVLTERAKPDDAPELVFVFDRFTSSQGPGFPPHDFRTVLMPKLLEPILKGLVPKTSFVLVMSEKYLASYGVADAQNNVLIDKLRAVPVEYLEESDAPHLLLEFCRYERTKSLEKLCELWYEEELKGHKSWSPSQFRSPFADTVRAILKKLPK